MKTIFAIAEKNFIVDEDINLSACDVNLPCELLSLVVGDRLIVHSQHEGWCYGSRLDRRNESGLFPSDAVRLTEKFHTADESMNGWDLLFEINNVTQIWWNRVKELYVKQTDVHYLDEVLGYVRDMLGIRKLIMSGDVPSETLNSIRLEITQKIDRGNMLLSLPVVIRQSNGTLHNLDNISLLQTFHEHLLSAKRVSSESKFQTSENETITSNFSILFGIQSIEIKTKYNCEITMVIYDLEKRQIISEAFSVHCKTDKSGKIIKNINARALFSSFSLEENSSRYVLMTRVAQISPIESSSSTLRKNPDHGPSNLFCRQLYAFDFLDLSFLFHKPRCSNDPTNKVIFLNRVDDFDQAFKSLQHSGKISKPNTSSDDVKLLISTQLLKGSYSEIIENRSYIFGRKAPVVIQRTDTNEMIESNRNELFVTLMFGEFATKSDKNVEARFSVVQSNGVIVENCFETMESTGPVRASNYKSYVFYHQEKPCWMEQIKILLPCYATEDLHLRITFHSKKSYDKSKGDKGPFALAHINLLQNAALIKNEEHELLVYKLEMSHSLDEKNTSYITLPQTKGLIRQIRETGNANIKPHSSVFSLSEKSFVHINTRTCSNVLTQNENIRNVLKWRLNSFNLASSLSALAQPVGESENDMLRFLSPLLDALFDIFFEREQLELSVFDVIVVILKLLDEPRNSEYVKDFDRYIELFSDGTASLKLIRCLNHYIVSAATDNNEKVRNALKVIGRIFHLIVASKKSQQKFQHDSHQHSIFCSHLEPLLDSIVGLMSEPRERMTIQNTALKHLPSIIDPVLKSGAYHVEKLCQWVIRVMSSFGKNIVARERLGFIGQLITTQLFEQVHCRSLLLHRSLDLLINHLDPESTDPKEFSERSFECVNILCSLLERMFSSVQLSNTPSMESGTDEELALLINACYRPVVRAMVAADQIHQSPCPNRNRYSALILAILNKMSAQIFDQYLKTCFCTVDKIDFVTEMLQMISDLLEMCPFPETWSQMIFLMNKTVYKALRFVMSCIQTHFSKEDFYPEIWEEYIVTSVSFIAQSSLRGEDFWSSEDIDISLQLRKSAAKDLRSTWFRLTHSQKMEYIPRLVGAFLKVALVEDDEIRDAIIPIFFDMMQCEFHSHTKIPSSGQFKRFSEQLILELDELVNENCGNRAFQEHFTRIFTMQCQSNRELWAQGGGDFIANLDQLLGLLFEYRHSKEVDLCVESVMSRIVQLMRHYQEREHPELYITYIYRLYELHVLYNNHVEAARTLLLHAELLTWTERELPEWLITRGLNGQCATELQLKENILSKAADLFADGEMWEDAIKILRELVPVYETIHVQYAPLANLLQKIANYFLKIESTTRGYFFYYMVVFYGRGFPSYLNGHRFIFRGEKLERYADFRSRMEQMYGNPESLPPTDDCSRYVNSPGRYIQILHVETIGRPCAFEDNTNVNPSVKGYYRHYNISDFEFTRSEIRKETKWTEIENTDIMKTWVVKKHVKTKEPLPGVLRCSEVLSVSQPIYISPLRLAVEQMTTKNKQLMESARLVMGGNAQEAIKPLQGSVMGVVQANVQGGVKNYEIFFSKACSEAFEIEEKDLAMKLSSLVVSQVEIMEYALFVLAKHAPSDVAPMHENLVASFEMHRNYVDDNFGKTRSMLEPGQSIHMNRISDQSFEKEKKTSSAHLRELREAFSSTNINEIPASPVGTLKSKGVSIGSTMLNILSPVRKVPSQGSDLVPNGNTLVMSTPSPMSSRAISTLRMDSRDSLISSPNHSARLPSISSFEGIRLRTQLSNQISIPPALPPRPIDSNGIHRTLPDKHDKPPAPPPKPSAF